MTANLYGKPPSDHDILSDAFDWTDVPTTFVGYNSHDGWHKFERLDIPARHVFGKYHEIPTDRVPELREARKGYRMSGLPSVARSQDRAVLLHHCITGKWSNE